MDNPDDMDPTFHRPDEMAGYLGALMHRQRADSSANFLQHFGFQEDPFQVSPDPRYIYPSQTHLEALATLENGFYNNRGFIAMIALPGMGKTTLLYRFLEDTQATARSVYLFDIDSKCTPGDFVGYILRDFGITPAGSSSEMHKQLGDVLVEETEGGRKCVLVIDEAQNLSDAVLERVRLLTNFETSQGKLLQVILSGQPQLTDRLMQDSLLQLRQRISTFCGLARLSAEETAAYIDYRLKQAGYDGDPLFTKDALKLIAETSLGTPRTINNLCFNALSLCCVMESKQVDGDMVSKEVAKLRLIPQSSEEIAGAGNVAAEQPGVVRVWKQIQRMLTPLGQSVANHVKIWVPAVAAVLILFALGVLRFTGVGASQPRTVGDEGSLSPKSATVSVPTSVAANTRKVITAKRAPSTTPSEQPSEVGDEVSALVSVAAVQPVAHAPKSLQANDSIPKPLEAAQAAVTPLQTSAVPQPPSPDAGANLVPAQESPPPAGRSGSPAGAPSSAAAAQVRAALPDNAQATLAIAMPDVRPALPAALPLMVQIAATVHTEDADALVSALRKLGYPATARHEPADNLIYVRIGPFYSRDEANRWRMKLLDDGYKAMIQP